MVTYIFGPILVVDRDGNPVPSAAGKVYDPNDTAFATPLPMTDMAGVNLVDAITNAKGYVSIKVQDHPEVVWKSGDIIQPLRSFGSVLDRAITAETVALEARDTSNAAAAAATINRVPLGGTSGQVLAKASNTDNDVTWINPPAGGGSGSGVVVLGNSDPIPPGTAAMTPIFRVAGDIPTPDEVLMLTGAGNLTSAYGSLTTSQTLSAPANTAAGDLLVAIGWCQASVAPFDWSVPAGWTSRFEAVAGRRLLVATYPVPDADAAGDVTAVTHTFSIPGDVQNARNGVMIFRVTGANLAAPIVGVSDYLEGTGTGKTFASFSASSPAAAQLLVWTAQLSSGAAQPVITHAAGYQAVNKVSAYNTAEPPAESVGTAVLYQISGTTVPERVESYTPSWSAGVWGLHLAIAGA